MLLQLIVKNYRSIKDEVSLSLLASKDKSHYEQLLDFDNQKVLRSAMIFGENSTGKSSIIEAARKVAYLVCFSESFENGSKIKAFPNFNYYDKPTYTAFYYTCDNIMYFYSIEYSDNTINSERLYYWPNGKKVMIFERDGENYEFNKAIKSDMKKIVAHSSSYKSLIPLASNTRKKSLEPFFRTFSFFKYKLIFSPISLNNCVEFLNDFSFSKATFVRFMKSLKIGFVDLTLGNTPEETYFTFENYAENINDLSAGLSQIVKLYLACYQTVIDDKTLMIDPIDYNLSVSFLTSFMQRFLNNGRNGGQIVGTCYSTELLNVNILRRDQIWFTTLDDETYATDLYSLGDINNVRKEENLRLGFLSGKYGALKTFNEDDKKLFDSY